MSPASAVAGACLVAVTYRARWAYLVGGFFLLGPAASAMLPNPAWFSALDLLGAYNPMAWLGSRIGDLIKPA